MKIIRHSTPVQITVSVPGFRIINDHVMKSLKAGFSGSATILLIIFFIKLLSYIISNEEFRMDFLDLFLAGLGFFLQMTGTLLKCLTK